MARQVTAGEAGGAWPVVARRGAADRGRLGGAGHGQADQRQGRLRQAWQGTAGRGRARLGRSRQARQGVAWRGQARQNEAGEADC